MHAIWNERALGRLPEIYSPIAELHGPAGRELIGNDQISGFYASWLAGLPDLRVVFDHIAVVERDAGFDVAVRWMLSGTHTGPGLLAAPRGAKLLLMAVSHWRLENDLVVEDWTVFDELAVLRQMYEGSP